MNAMAYSYIRMSTEKQIKGDSLRRQMEWSQAYAAKHGLLLQEQFSDIGVSAWKGLNRSKGRLGAFMQLVRDGTIPSSSYLLIENLDRLSRTTPLEALDQFKDILKAGITVVARGEFGEEETYTWNSLNTNSSQLMSTLTSMLRANRESERKSQIIREAFETKRLQSQAGKRTNQTVPSWITATRIGRGEYEYALNERADTVRWIFEQSASGVGLDAIARQLNVKQVPTLRPSKHGWYFTGVSNIITSRTAIGEYQPHRIIDGQREPVGDPIAGYYPAVVDADLFVRAQKLAKRSKSGGRAGTTFSNLLTGLNECAHCGSTMHMQTNSQSKTQWRYLVCPANFRKSTNPDGTPVCPKGSTRFRYDLVEKLILDNVVEFGVDDLVRMNQMDDEIQSLDKSIAQHELTLEDLRNRESRLIQVVETGDADEIPGLLVALKTRTNECKRVESELTELQVQRETQVALKQSQDPFSAIQSLRDAWTTETDPAQCYALRARCNRAMRGVIDWVHFNSEENRFYVVLFGGLTAYQFDNFKHVHAGSVNYKAEKVDLTGTAISTKQFDPVQTERAMEYYRKLNK